MGIAIVQSSQFITIVGGPNGYILCLNSFVADVVRHEARTGALGSMTDCMYFGAAIGFLIRGIISDAFGILAPFRMTLVLFLFCCVYVALTLPATSPPEVNKSDATSQITLGLSRFFCPLRIFMPQKCILPDGRTMTEFGAQMLGIGVFLGILATGYIPVLLQQYATGEFYFGTTENAYLIFMYSSLRGVFLTLIFPRVISRGRAWLQPRDGAKSKPPPPLPRKSHFFQMSLYLLAR